MNRLGMTFQQAAKAASVTEQNIIDAIKAGDLTAHLHGNRVIVLTTDLETWLNGLPLWVSPQASDAKRPLRLA